MRPRYSASLPGFLVSYQLFLNCFHYCFFLLQVIGKVMPDIELVERQMNKIIEAGHYSVNYEYLYLALAFHGFIYSVEQKIRDWLCEQGYAGDVIDQIVKISPESQRPEIPETLEGKILHDAHVLEGGKNYTVVKTLITGSVRG